LGSFCWPDGCRRKSPLPWPLAGIWTLAPMTQDMLPVQIWLNARWLLFGP
jgi:hypothetical protein